MNLKLLVKRGALIAAANWPVIAIQFVAETTFKVLLAVPIIGAAILVAVLFGTDLADLLQGSLREIFTTIASALWSEPVALVAFMTSFSLALLGGSVLTFVVKAGTVEVLVAANAAAGPVERGPLTWNALRGASAFSVPRFMNGCSRLYRPYVRLGIVLMVLYGASVGAFLAFLSYGYYMATGRLLIIGWTFIAALAALVLYAWITIINLLYLLMQVVMAMAPEGAGGIKLRQGVVALARFIRSEFRDLAATCAVFVVLVVAAALASALAWSGVGLIAFVPLVGLAVFPLQIVALIVQGLLFEYLGLTTVGSYAALYGRYALARREADGKVPEPSPKRQPRAGSAASAGA